jgi:glutamate racemase
MTKKREQPIGIFDSGIGGLTVAHAIKNVLPQENMIYFGDTAHLPYGDKSEAAIQAYSIKIADILLKKGCKVIVIACNSASSASYELLNEYVRRDTHIINVIDPMVEYVVTNYPSKKYWLDRNQAHGSVRNLPPKNFRFRKKHHLAFTGHTVAGSHDRRRLL